MKIGPPPPIVWAGMELIIWQTVTEGKAIFMCVVQHCHEGGTPYSTGSDVCLKSVFPLNEHHHHPSRKFYVRVFKAWTHLIDWHRLSISSMFDSPETPNRYVDLWLNLVPLRPLNPRLEMGTNSFCNLGFAFGEYVLRVGIFKNKRSQKLIARFLYKDWLNKLGATFTHSCDFGESRPSAFWRPKTTMWCFFKSFDGLVSIV